MDLLDDAEVTQGLKARTHGPHEGKQAVDTLAAKV